MQEIRNDYGMPILAIDEITATNASREGCYLLHLNNKGKTVAVAEMQLAAISQLMEQMSRCIEINEYLEDL